MEQKFRRLTQLYIDGWKENNINKIIQPLANNCVIVESHGPTYSNVKEIKQWFSFWKQEKGKVLHWKINSFYFIKKENIAFLEWNFVCNVSNKKHSLFGISIVKFQKNKISFIHEYRMTKNPYKWNASRLNPE